MPKSTKQPENFEAGLAELESLVGQMEAGNLPLDQALAQYQRGAELLRFCEEKLSSAEQQLRVLDGETLKPFTPDN
jgi:exodeoxyribonuclease VII small subunit